MSTGEPLISIVLCTYNGSRFLAEQLRSLLAQSYSNFEIVASDDASSDDTVAILQRWASADARIRVLMSEQNAGFDRNFERALRYSRGDFIAPCDQDDVWLPEKLEMLRIAIGGRSMAYCDSMLIDERGEAIGYSMSQVVPTRSIDDPAPFAFGNCVSGHAMLFRRELLELGLPIPPHFFYDWWLAAVAASMKGIEFCDRQLVLYRQHGENVTNRRLAEMLEDAGLDRSRLSLDLAAVSSSTSGARKSGHKWHYLQETQERLAALARLPSERQSFLLELHRLWRARESQWLSPRLWCRMLKNRDRLLALTMMSERDRSRYCADFFWGLRMKRLSRRSAYRAA